MLTIHQTEIALEAVRILKTTKNLVIKGSAGVGKTYLLGPLLNMLDLPKFSKIYVTAPTNKAVNVLKEKINQEKNIEFLTTHSALSLKREINPKTGEISFKPDKYNRKSVDNVSCIIIDECSMLNSELLDYIKEVFHGKFIIFTGDDKQINPVNENNSPIFHQNYPELELTEIIRQKEGNPIIHLSRNLDLLDSKSSVSNNNIGYEFSNDSGKIVRSLVVANGTDEMKYLAWTNSDVNKVNRIVRESIYGMNPNKIELGETLIFNQPYIIKDKIYFTNQEIKVERLSIIEKKELKYYVVNDEIKIIHENSEGDFKRIKGYYIGKAKKREIPWKAYYDFVEQFADIKYNHALTVHKSQGSTFKKVAINLKDIRRNTNLVERERLLYTAVTRASDLLIIYNY